MILIRADADYYPMDRIAPFWSWLLGVADAGSVKMPLEIYDEICDSRDRLGQWLRQAEVKEAIVLDELPDLALVQEVIEVGYGPSLTEIGLQQIGRDPFLVAFACRRRDRVVVTREVSRPSAKGANRKIPDICADFGIACINDYELWRRLDFRIR